MGHVPRMMSVSARGETTRLCCPGDMVTITGVFGLAPTIGREVHKTGTLQDVFIEAFKITKEKKSYSQVILSEEVLARIDAEKGKDNYTRVFLLYYYISWLNL
jgi:DNA replicative helicase MCM subunit Mcm2 (Cdc46/Mcm family)